MTDDQITFQLKYLGGLSTSEAEACLVSRDAIIPVIEKQDDGEFYLNFIEALWDEQHPSTESKDFRLPYYSEAAIWLMIKAIPRQLCIALLKATGKWKEK